MPIPFILQQAQDERGLTKQSGFSDPRFTQRFRMISVTVCTGVRRPVSTTTSASM
jgi:hypothetical protein